MIGIVFPLLLICVEGLYAKVKALTEDQARSGYYHGGRDQQLQIEVPLISLGSL